MYSIRRTADATTEPVTLQEAKSHCRVEVDDDDAMLQKYIKAARQYCEEATGRAFLEQTWRLSLDRFPQWRETGSVFRGWTSMQAILLPRPQLMAVSSVTYLDPSGVQQTIPPANYLVDAGAEPAQIMPAPGRCWPFAACVSGSVQVTYTAGYGENADDVPAALQLAILMLVGHWYENREATVLPDSGTGVVSVPLGVADLLSAYTLDVFTLES